MVSTGEITESHHNMKALCVFMLKKICYELKIDSQCFLFLFHSDNSSLKVLFHFTGKGFSRAEGYDSFRVCCINKLSAIILSVKRDARSALIMRYTWFACTSFSPSRAPTQHAGIAQCSVFSLPFYCACCFQVRKQ